MRVVTTKDKKMPKNKNGMQNFCFKIKKSIILQTLFFESIKYILKIFRSYSHSF